MADNQLEKVKNEFDSVLTMVMDAKSEQRKKRKNCKLCQSKYCDEAEAIYEVKHNAADVIRFLHTKGEVISPTGIRNHLDQHWKADKTNLTVREYAENLLPYMNVRRNKISTLQMLSAILTKEMVEVVAQSTSKSGDEKRKGAELAMKLAQAIVNLQEAEDRIEGDLQPIHIFIQRFQQIYQAEQNSASPDLRQRLDNVINTLYDQCGDIVIERKK